MGRRGRRPSSGTIQAAVLRRQERNAALNFHRTAEREAWKRVGELPTLLRPYLLPAWLRDQRPDMMSCVRRLAADVVRAVHRGGSPRGDEQWRIVTLTCQAESILTEQLMPWRGQSVHSAARKAVYLTALERASISPRYLPFIVQLLPQVPRRGLK